MNKLGKLQKAIIHLFHDDDYIGVDQVIEHLNLQRTRSNLVSVRRAFHLLRKRGVLNVAKYDYDDGHAWGLIAWLPHTKSPTVTEEIKVTDVESVVLNFLNYLKEEFNSDSGVDYKIILKYIKKLNGKIGNIHEDDARVPVSYHRALKSLATKNSIVLDFIKDNGRIEAVSLNSSNNI
ncbi:hypothetical protein [Solidesulfovibrio magneticus]|uniref:Uncharacterized protein n=1 Tax=Solidesulfovibrio magneticus (strain ATCC 700980 / DSM 13731 / RS-1) TaxID=573370 RepID=C4XLI2_SOLM1|nr:hypothetical protein [Solidesulfovibrio magneticus]BAH77121.1 hypothetical protein DMR_36300 [Solidesulfovibrio magneticus RS-1]